MLSWLLLAVLGMIWAAFLIPARRRSPSASVEEFEQKMTVLKEAGGVSPGRWVLVPRKGGRFMGPSDRQRARVRRRRRQVFVVLLEATGLTFIMGLFPPFRIVLFATAMLILVLLAYASVLVKIRMEAIERPGAAPVGRPVDPSRSAAPNGNGHPTASMRGNGHVAGGNGNGHIARDLVAAGLEPFDFEERGVRIVDDDVHIVVYRSGDVDVSKLASSG